MVSVTSQIKKLKTETKSANSFHFKGNEVQFEFNSGLLDTVNRASYALLGGNLVALNKELASLIRFADKIPAGWKALEEYESDELADDSED